MIKKECFSREWIYHFREQPQYSRIDYVSFEKMVLALHLVEQLRIVNLNFVFKGGTSLSLLYNEPRRFSIDVDIVTEETKENIHKILPEIIERSRFKRFEYDERRSFVNEIPKAHYKFYFDSAIDGNENYVILDVLFEKPDYPELTVTEIKNVFVEVEKESVMVNVPSINSIVGDKLTAFAPNTISMRFSAGKNLKIIKQLFDLGVLSDNITNYEIVASSYKRIAQKELAYRKLDIKVEETLQDTINSSLILAKREKNKGDDLEKYSALKSGITRFQSYLVSGSFNLDTAIEASAKTALLAAKILKEDYSPLPAMEDRRNFAIYRIENAQYNYLDRLIRIPNNALFYWHETIKSLS